jgi:hypothetical protein
MPLVTEGICRFQLLFFMSYPRKQPNPIKDKPETPSTRVHGVHTASPVRRVRACGVALREQRYILSPPQDDPPG